MLTPSRFFSTITHALPPAKYHKLPSTSLPTHTETSKAELLKYLEEMITIRRIEITSDRLYKDKEIRGFCHLCDGQESISVGLEAGVTFEDHLITAYRDHGQAYMRGISVKQIFAEMFGRVTGSSLGKGGSMHFYNKSTNFYGGNGIVGAQCPVGAGLAFALKYEEKPNIAMVMFGDGCVNEGELYEANNLAALWKLPAVFICENNLYGMGTSVERASASTELYTRGDYVPGIEIEAQDVLMVRETMKFAKEYALEKGPLWLEFMTYRYHGHSMSDPGSSYRERTEIEKIREERDPIERVKKILLENGLVGEDEVKNMEKKIRKEVDEIATEALKDAMPAEGDLFTHIYAPGTEIFIRNVEVQDSIVLK